MSHRNIVASLAARGHIPVYNSLHEIFTPLKCYSVWIGTILPTFRDNV